MLPSYIVRAEWIAPMDAPMIRDGAVAFEGDRILDVGAADAIERRYPRAAVDDIGAAVLLPGLVNAHTHLELSNCRAGERPPGTFVDWVLSLRPQIGSMEVATLEGISQSIHAGVTCLGDISQQPGITRPIIAKHPIRCVSFGEIIAMAARRYRYDELLPAAMETTVGATNIRNGLSPHAPYTVELPFYQRLLEISRTRALPLATHLAELPEEAAFLSAHTGMFRDLWETLGWWDHSVQTHPGPPIRFAKDVGLLDAPTLLAHVNYCDDTDLKLLAGGRASVVYCPRTHRYFGHPPHRWRDMLAAGINVAVGTDSCASSPDLDLVDDLRLLRQIAPDVPAAILWEMATIRGARALTWEADLGSIAPTKLADFCAFAVSGRNPLEEILQQQIPAAGVWVGGERLI
jgi:cytosine/adenosine deaminase-related metal-dependent hydrolase